MCCLSARTDTLKQNIEQYKSQRRILIMLITLELKIFIQEKGILGKAHKANQMQETLANTQPKQDRYSECQNQNKPTKTSKRKTNKLIFKTWPTVISRQVTEGAIWMVSGVQILKLFSNRGNVSWYFYKESFHTHQRANLKRRWRHQNPRVCLLGVE